MDRRVAKRRLQGAGEIILVCYLLLVVGVALMQALTGFPTVAQLASSPVLLLGHGEWWRLFTSALVVNGPVVPQVAAIGALGSLSIYFGGSWLFWKTALAGHIFGTLVAYAGLPLVWLLDHSTAERLLIDPDYGVSLVWCAALGAFAALCWLGKRADWRRPAQPLLTVAAVLVMVLVTVYSDEMAAIQHVLAFAIGFVIIGTADRSRVLHKSRRPLRVRKLA